ncbi:MAG: hypothetical protein EKK34_01225 [Mycobacterium sp.]|nr:MAG: hypothetical protein EKK34_01225 [Mycobacterium sp.]
MTQKIPSVHRNRWAAGYLGRTKVPEESCAAQNFVVDLVEDCPRRMALHALISVLVPDPPAGLRHDALDGEISSGALRHADELEYRGQISARSITNVRCPQDERAI